MLFWGDISEAFLIMLVRASAVQRLSQKRAVSQTY